MAHPSHQEIAEAFLEKVNSNEIPAPLSTQGEPWDVKQLSTILFGSTEHLIYVSRVLTTWRQHSFVQYAGDKKGMMYLYEPLTVGAVNKIHDFYKDFKFSGRRDGATRQQSVEKKVSRPKLLANQQHNEAKPEAKGLEVVIRYPAHLENVEIGFLEDLPQGTEIIIRR